MTTPFPHSKSYKLLKWVITVAQRCVSSVAIAELTERYILTILLTFSNSGTLLCYNNDTFL